MSESTETVDLRAVIEMLGHRVVAGRVQECKRFGVEGTLIDVPAADGSPAWQTFVAGSAIYAVTPCSQAQALGYIQRNFQRPPQYLQRKATMATMAVTKLSVEVVRGHGYVKVRARRTDSWTFYGRAAERSRPLRRPFKRAREAVGYARAVEQRLRRLRAAAA